jgi:hypothetical protein
VRVKLRLGFVDTSHDTTFFCRVFYCRNNFGPLQRQFA